MQRTNNDTWDLASSVGATATMVAAGRARATRSEHPLIDDPFAEPLVRAVGIDFFTRWAAGELDAAEVDHPDFRWGMQRMTNVMAARTRHIDAFFADASAAGIRQAIILASGLDARGYRLPWPAATTVFEIDQPAVLEFKAATLAGLGAKPTAELRAVPIDLRHDWPPALCGAGFDTQRPTAWIAEGLLAFLPSEGQDHLLDNITALSTEGSRLVTDTFINGPHTQQALEAVYERWYDHGLNVTLGNLSYPGERNDVATYLQARGWRTVGTPLEQLLIGNGLPLPAAKDDEDDEMAPFADNYYCTAVLHQQVGHA